jgi:hypothetical protein
MKARTRRKVQLGYSKVPDAGKIIEQLLCVGYAKGRITIGVTGTVAHPSATRLLTRAEARG